MPGLMPVFHELFDRATAGFFTSSLTGLMPVFHGLFGRRIDESVDTIFMGEWREARSKPEGQDKGWELTMV
jgi:hypothetical protein